MVVTTGVRCIHIINIVQIIGCRSSHNYLEYRIVANSIYFNSIAKTNWQAKPSNFDEGLLLCHASEFSMHFDFHVQPSKGT